MDKVYDTIIFIKALVPLNIIVRASERACTAGIRRNWGFELDRHNFLSRFS